MTRRGLLQGLLAAGVWGAVGGRGNAAQPASMKAVEDLQKNWKMLLADGAKIPSPTEPLKLTNEEWRKRLDKAQYYVLREEGTERPGTSILNQEKRPGIFTCAGCDLPLFTSEMKYESGTHRVQRVPVTETQGRIHTSAVTVAILPEAAGIIFGGGFLRVDSIEGRKAAQRAIFHVQRELERVAVSEEYRVILCDRGTLDGIAYWPNHEESFLTELGISKVKEFARYAHTLQVVARTRLRCGSGGWRAHEQRISAPWTVG